MQQIINKYLEGKATHEEQVFLLEWLRKKENRADFNSYSLSWKENLDEKKIPEDQKKNWNKIQIRILEKGYQQWQRAKKINIFFRIAAIFFFAITIAGLSWYFTHTKPNPVFYTSVMAEKGQISKVELPDGSLVWLNSGSEIRYSNMFADKNRNIQLTGEAYFNVAKNEIIPLQVNCGEIHIKVHGTKFNVTTRKENRNVDVVLEEGLVELLDSKVESFNYRLQPGERAIFDLKERKLNVSNVNTSKFTSWKDGIINIYDQSLEQLVKRLETRYNQKFELGEGVNNFRYTFTIKNEPLDEIIKLMEKITPLKAVQKDDIIVFEVDEAKIRSSMK